MRGLGRAIDWAAERALAAARSFGRGHRSEGLDAASSAAEPAASAAPVAALPSMIWIRYVNQAGEASERTVTLREGWRDGEGLHLKAWCHLRREARVFDASGIQELLCLATGERPRDPVRWIETYALLSRTADDDQTHRAMAAARDELALLAFLGRADGALDADEIEVMIDHVTRSAGRSVDAVRCAALLRRLAPDPDELPQVLQRVAADPERWDRLRRSAHRLLLADGKVSTDELDAWRRVQGPEATADDAAAREAELLALVERSALGTLLAAERP